MAAQEMAAAIQAVRELTAKAPDSYPSAAAAVINGCSVEARAVYSATARRRITYKLAGRRVGFCNLLLACHRGCAA